MRTQKDIDSFIKILPQESLAEVEVPPQFNEARILLNECAEIEVLRSFVNEVTNIEYSFTSGS